MRYFLSWKYSTNTRSRPSAPLEEQIMPSSHSITRRSALLAAPLAAAAGSLVCAGVASAEEVSSQLSSNEALDFLYIDCAEMYAGETQNVAVALTGYTGIGAATLYVLNSDAGEEVPCALSVAADSSALFSFAPEYAGSYEVVRMDFTSAEGAFTLDFSDCDASYRSFAVSYGVSTLSLMSDEGAEDGPTLQVYTDDGTGEVAESASIEDGAAVALSSRARSRAEKSNTVVIALDPGHVGVSGGAQGVNGAREEVCTWKIAKACGDALSAYANAKVVYTVKQGETLPIPSGSNELRERVNSAVKQGADVLVSIHLNSSNGYAYGAEVYVPRGDADYNYNTHTVGKDLGQKILTELEKLGLYDRGVKIRSWDEYCYPDGSGGDYYGIIRNAREENLPAIIIEHAFIDNWSDYSKFLNSDAKLAALGQADARGIVNSLGLAMAEGSVYRLYNPNSGEHLFTQDFNEYRTLGSYGWQQEGCAWISPDEKTSSTPVYRLYNPNSGDHHYTTEAHEYETLGGIGWKKEGVFLYSDEEGQEVPIYRLFNPNETIGTHHFTTNESEYKTLGSLGWKQEGIAWYGISLK